jgi:hypothetical protein
MVFVTGVEAGQLLYCGIAAVVALGRLSLGIGDGRVVIHKAQDDRRNDVEELHVWLEIVAESWQWV